MRESLWVSLAIEKIEKYQQIYKEQIARGEQPQGYSKRFLGTVLFSEHPEVYKDVDAARDAIRYVTGSGGTAKRKKRPDDSLERLQDAFALMASPVRELDITPFVVPSGYNNTLVISDIHSRFYDRTALEIAINDGIKNKCNSVIILGDFMDFYGDSKFDKSPAILRYFDEERELGIDMLKLLQKEFGYVVLQKGNHDIRRELHVQRLAQSMPEIMDLASYNDYLFYDGSSVRIVEDYQIIEYGKLSMTHGNVLGGGGVHVAHNRLKKAMMSIMTAHSHVKQSSITPNLKGEPVGSWTLGCLCDLHPRYNPGNNWTHGFAVVRRDASGLFEVENKVIFGKRILN